jgi:hypothetical protein
MMIVSPEKLLHRVANIAFSFAGLDRCWLVSRSLAQGFLPAGTSPDGLPGACSSSSILIAALISYEE